MCFTRESNIMLHMVFNSQGNTTLSFLWGGWLKSCSQPNMVYSRGATEQSTLAERGKFHENSIPILRVDYSYVYKYITTYWSGYVF